MKTTESIQEFQMAAILKEELLTAVEKTMAADGISQGEVARRIGAIRSNINKIMRRKYPVSVDFLLKMAESIDLNVEMKVKKAKT